MASTETIKIILPNFDNSNEDSDFYTIFAEINGSIVGEFNFYFFDRFNFIEETENCHNDFNFFARQLEFYEFPYLNDNGIYVMVINNFNFDKSFDNDYKIAFLTDSIKSLANKYKRDIADIYAIVADKDIQIYKNAKFEFIENDKEFGNFMHYVPGSSFS